MFFNFKKSKQEQIISSPQSVVDFSILDPRATQKDISDYVNIAIKNKYYAVCVNSFNVEYAKSLLKLKANEDIKIVSTIGFPLGACSKQTKLAEVKQAISDGADELDVVINIAAAKDGDYDYVKDELSRIVRISKGKVVKAIIETCYFSKDEIIKLCKICTKTKVDYIKTSTGFGTGGATPEIVALIKAEVNGKCQIKAAGAVRTTKQAEDLIRAGATRIGTSTEI